ncbi:hypothetical protein [uncultured Thiodictyon sp.]|uniref:hypothetical protein n=1 Tax=uncultured Thiodictyon sp. TaxID=1846217 RepID=UPI0025CC71FE|nr:hypothetical protein [uncultured Thiodictyon sp.]
MNSEALYVDLAENEVITIALLADKSLPVDAFANKYKDLIQEHYKARGLDRDDRVAYDEAAALHAYLMGT